MTIALDERGHGCGVRHEGLGGISGRSGAAVLDEAWDAAAAHVGELRAILDAQE